MHVEKSLDPSAIEWLQAENIRLHERVTALERTECTLQRHTAEADALYETTLGLMKGLDASEVLQSILTRAGQLLDTEHGYVCLVAPDGNHIVFGTTMGVFEKFTGERMQRGEGATGKVWQSGRPLVVNDYDTWAGHSPTFVANGLRALLAVPLVSDSEIIGVLGLTYHEAGKIFDADSMTLLERFAPLATIALENARLYSAVQQELEERTRAEAIIRAQQETLHALSTPLIPISDDVVVMPLVGALDTQRAVHVMDALLEGIGTHGARCAILDITGVAVIDTQIASMLIQAAQAVRLLGARVILTGIRPDIAQTLVQLGTDLGGMTTCSTVQSGIAHAARRLE